MSTTLSLMTEHDVYLFKEGNHERLYNKLGAHEAVVDGRAGTHFAVWAPNAEKVSLVGDFNGWQPDAHPLFMREDHSGIWETFIPGVGKGTIYKYHLVSRFKHYTVDKADPFACYAEVPPKTASIVWDLEYAWQDSEWMENRYHNNALNAPISVYEMHLGSWKRIAEEGGRSLSYRELAHQLAAYVKEMGFTHVEFLPVMEHPFYGSWGYETTGYFAPTSRYGSPQDFMYLIDCLHRQGIGVFLDWVPSHFPSDEFALVFFDGTHLYEHADPRKGFHPDWNSYIFNHGRNEVKAFLISSALFWFDKYHIDGIRVDAVASMIYLDYSRKEGEWIPNQYGGRDNLEAIAFLKRFNEAIYREYPDVQTIAEESTAWPMVSRPLYIGGMGFGMKWNMGWMHDTLKYFSNDPVYRKYSQNQITFSIWYAFAENFILSLSHDEVVYGKGSLLKRMPGDEWQQFANLRILLGYMYGHPGKKLLFMGGEFAQKNEWNHEGTLDWHLLTLVPHQGMHHWVKDVNRVYRSEPSLYELDFSHEGFEWIDFSDTEKSIVSFTRKSRANRDIMLMVCNLTPVPRYNYRVGVPRRGSWKEILNSDAELYGGSGHGNFGAVEATPVAAQGRHLSISLTLPPLSVLFFRSEGE